MDEWTIFAPATGTQSSAVGIMRLSGTKALDIIGKVLKGVEPIPRQFCLMDLVEPATGQVMDKVGVIIFKAPSSFTGEDIVEIHHHGSSAISRWMSDCFSNTPGYRIAEQGEFTRRSLRYGKMRIHQAEAIGQLVNAKSTDQVRIAAAALSGAAEEKFRFLQAKLKSVLVALEAEIDFGDEGDVGEGLWLAQRNSISALADQLQIDLKRSREVKQFTDGIRVVIYGAPNVGKSSLLNALVRREIAIVTKEAGTTRDPIEVMLEINGRLVRLVDTAGIRESHSIAEQIGIARTTEWLEHADLKILVSDDLHVLRLSKEIDTLCVLSKADNFAEDESFADDFVVTSALKGIGISKLLDAIDEKCRHASLPQNAGDVWNMRQCSVMEEVIECLLRFLTIPGHSLDLAAEEIRIALCSVGKVMGHTHSEQLLDDIFGQFCIGK